MGIMANARPITERPFTQMIVATGFEEQDLGNGTTLYSVLVESAGERRVAVYISMPTALCRPPELYCVRTGCDMRVCPMK
jgi:hypothetical protein